MTGVFEAEKITLTLEHGSNCRRESGRLGLLGPLRRIADFEVISALADEGGLRVISLGEGPPSLVHGDY